MSRGINKAIIIGNVVADPEIRYGANGSAVVNVRVATNEEWKDKDGVKQTSAEYHAIVIFGKLGEIAGQYLKKGNPAYFEGRIKTRKWEDKDGNTRYTTEIIAKEMQFLDSKGDRNSESQLSGGGYKPGFAEQSDQPGGGGFHDDPIPFNKVDWRAS